MPIGVSVFALEHGFASEARRPTAGLGRFPGPGKITLRMFRAPEPPPSWFPGPGKSNFKGCGGPERMVLNVLIGHTKHPIF